VQKRNKSCEAEQQPAKAGGKMGSEELAPGMTKLRNFGTRSEEDVPVGEILERLTQK